MGIATAIALGAALTIGAAAGLMLAALLINGKKQDKQDYDRTTTRERRMK